MELGKGHVGTVAGKKRRLMIEDSNPNIEELLDARPALSNVSTPLTPAPNPLDIPIFDTTSTGAAGFDGTSALVPATTSSNGLNDAALQAHVINTDHLASTIAAQNANIADLALLLGLTPSPPTSTGGEDAGVDEFLAGLDGVGGNIGGMEEVVEMPVVGKRKREVTVPEEEGVGEGSNGDGELERFVEFD
ncbi:hypothetical protein SAICODRAFT_30200 [Saitoella complicata NRRL Y-17804]|nr:uncharacterized protein SAICODRAFT_30200 [Saitoella complicata NRRL Y-17804]ODQ53084.1 hypothetical protein SAICODRAFT_30200 [Saitoella complicata NRRL Y-17804]